MEMYTVVFVLAGILLASSVIISVWGVSSAARGNFKLSTAVLTIIVATAVGMAGFLGLEQASRAKFSLGQDGFSFLRTIEFRDLVKRNHLSFDSCRSEDASPLCTLTIYKEHEQLDDRIIVVQSDSVYRLRYGHWPNTIVVELPKNRVKF